MKTPHTGFKGDSIDHKFRSGYIQWLLQQNISNTTEKIRIPKVIIQFWDNLKQLPKDVKKCLNSWNILKDFGFEVILFSEESAKKFIEKEYPKEYLLAYEKCNHPAMKCDYFRLCYIYKYGGAYVDADEVFLDKEFIKYFENNNIKIQPMCYDINKNEMVNILDFVEDKSYPDNRIFYVNNNPIIAPPSHKFIEIALNSATKNLLNHNVSIKFDIQSTTGPGNLTTSLVDYAMQLRIEDKSYDFEMIKNWDNVSKEL